MPTKKIFCSVPWTNTHIYWDGSYGTCCSENCQPHNDRTNYNLSNMQVIEWFNSLPMQTVRQQIKSNTPLDLCKDCYVEESYGHESRRIKENLKTVIFTEQAFERSYQQSPYVKDFANNVTDRLPIDWHVDLGNECNLACKMCEPVASSKISSLYQKWNLIPVSANSNWTLNDQSWQNFISSIESVPNLNRIHFMGGEPLLNKRFPKLLDHLINIGRTNISISFVTNGTIVNQSIINQLLKFKTCNIEVSIESITDNNHYIRQGSVTSQVLKNINWLIDQQTDKFSVVLRTVPQLFNVNNYDKLISYAYDKKVAIQSIPLVNPAYLKISVLPEQARSKLLPQYYILRDYLRSHAPDIKLLTTGRNTSNLELMLIRETDTIISMLESPCPDNVDHLRTELIIWMNRWDKEFNLNALTVYPEFADFFIEYGYKI